MIVLKNILVATDFGEPSDAALTYGRDLARTFGATLHVLHVVETSWSALPAKRRSRFCPSCRRRSRTMRGNASRRSSPMRTGRRSMPRPLSSRRSAPPTAIVQYAKDHAIDLIVMGTHGRRALAHVLMGSVAERVVRMAPCPVLTVRHPEREFVAPDALVAVARA